VLDATLELLAEGGHPALSFEAIAQRAGVNRTTLYRRWGTREAVMLDALLEQGRERVPIPDTGSLHGDLVAYGEAIAKSLVTPETEALVRAVVSSRDAPLADASRRFWRTRLELAREMVEHAIARREVPPDTDADALLEALLGGIYFRLLMSREEIDGDFVRRLADLLSAPPARLKGRRRAAS
jgi:AcrR family transcriptional regulator